VKTTGSRESGVEDIHTIGRAQHHNSVRSCKPVHFNEQLVEGLILLHFTSTSTSVALASGSIDFINENNTRCLGARLFEQRPHATCPDANEHFHELRAGGGKERHTRFSSNCLCQ